MKSISNIITLILAIAGLCVATYLTIDHFMPKKEKIVACGTIGDCHGVLASKYGAVGPIPTAAFGMGMYGLIAGLCLARRKRMDEQRRQEVLNAAAHLNSTTQDEETRRQAEAELGGEPTSTPVAASTSPTHASEASAAVRQTDLLIWGLATLGVCISFWLQYTAIFTLMSFCPWCFGSASIVTLIFLLSTRDFWIDGRKLSGEQKMLASLLALITAAMAFMVFPTIQEQYAKIMEKNPGPAEILPGVIPRDRIATTEMPVKGKKDAKYILVEFADYQCPACRKAVEIADQVIKTNPDVKLAFRNFPLDKHEWARFAAAAALAAKVQGKFWEMHDAIYEIQDEMETPDFKATRFTDLARKLNLDVDKFEKDRASEKILTAVQTDLDAGTAGGMNMTPSFFFVSPTSVWRFSGIQELEKAMSDRKHPMWK